MMRGREWGIYHTILVFSLGIAGCFTLGHYSALVAVLVYGIIYMCYQRCFLRLWVVVPTLGILNFGALGVVVSDYHIQKHKFHVLDQFVGTELVLEGIVIREADTRDFNTRLTVYVESYETNMLVKIPFYPTYNYGDQIRLVGSLELPQGFVGDTGRYFDYQNFLLKDNIRYLMNYPETELVATNQGHVVTQWLLDSKQLFIDQLRTIIPEPHVSLLGGLLVGAKSAMGQDLLDDFRDTGVIHIVVLSGFNITIVVAFVMAMLGWMGQRSAAIVGTIGIFCFALMTGAGATVVRASLMAFLVILARVTGNHAAVMRMLCIAGFLMLLWNPMLLLYDPSFQLSFMATFGLIVVTPYIDRYLRWVPNPQWGPLRELLAATLSTQIMVTPLLLWMMGTFPTYSPITNFLILVTVPWVMLTGFLVGVCSFFSYGLAFVFVGITYLILSYELWIVDIFANLPFASFTVPPFGFEWVIGVYCLYAVIGYRLYQVNKS